MSEKNNYKRLNSSRLYIFWPFIQLYFLCLINILIYIFKNILFYFFYKTDSEHGLDF